MQIPTTRFGVLELKEEDLITLPEGILGFPELKRYVIFDGPEPFKWLQAIDAPAVAFVICDPLLFKPDYRVQITAPELARMGLERPEEGVVCVILVIPPDPREMTANLLGPLVFNPRKRLGMQLVLNESSYPTKYRVFQEGS